MTDYTACEFIETYTGRAFFPLHPNPDAVSIIDIAHALSNECRFGGHVSVFYSVAQHSCLLAEYARSVLKAGPLDCLQMLMHDSPEAYLVDIPRPIKQHLPDYRKWEAAIKETILVWLGIDGAKHPIFEHELDARIANDEREKFMSKSGLDWKHGVPPLGIDIVAWKPPVAEKQFLQHYAMYTHAVFGYHNYLHDGWGPLKGTCDSGSDSDKVHSLIEVDLRGDVGRIKLRTDDGMLIRDRDAGIFPRAASHWLHGKFTLTEVAGGN